MYNPRVYAISIAKIIGISDYLIGEIEKDPLAFVSSFLTAKYDTSKEASELIDSFDAKFSKYENIPLCSWDENDAKELRNDLKIIFSI